MFSKLELGCTGTQNYFPNRADEREDIEPNAILALLGSSSLPCTPLGEVAEPLFAPRSSSSCGKAVPTAVVRAAEGLA